MASDGSTGPAGAHADGRRTEHYGRTERDRGSEQGQARRCNGADSGGVLSGRIRSEWRPERSADEGRWTGHCRHECCDDSAPGSDPERSREPETRRCGPRSAVRDRCWEHYARRVSSDDWCCKRNAQCLDAAVRGAGTVGERSAKRGKGTCGHLRNGRELHAAERRTGSAAADGEHRTAVPGARADDDAEHSAVRDPVCDELPAADADDGDWAESSLERARTARVAGT